MHLLKKKHEEQPVSRQSTFSSPNLTFLSQQGEHNRPPSLFEPLDGILERAKVNAVKLFENIAKLDASFLYLWGKNRQKET